MGVYRLHRWFHLLRSHYPIEEGFQAMSTATLDNKLSRALELIGGTIDPEIEESFPSLEARILAQALENVEIAERRLREIQELVGDIGEVMA
jgi:hypothetical protein